MSAYTGSLVPITAPLVALDRIVLVLLVGALVVAWPSDRLEPRRRHGVALVALGMALGLLALHAVHLLQLEPARRALRDVTTNLVRLGSFDANLGFFLDPMAALLLLLSLGGSTFFLARAKFGKKDTKGARRLQASVLLLCAGVSTTLLADGFVGLLMGLSLATVATFLLVVREQGLSDATSTANRIFFVQSSGTAALLAAFVLLFWSMGGTFREDGYLGDFRARFVAVHAPGHVPSAEGVVAPDETPRGARDAATIARKAKEHGSLTFTSHPGARVFLDATDQNLERTEPFAIAPFVRKDISAGSHEVIIVPGAGAIVSGDGHEVAWIERVIVGVDEDVSLVPLGQTATFSEVDDQLQLVDDEGKHFMRNAVFGRTLLGGINVVLCVVFLATLGALLVAWPVLLVRSMAGRASLASNVTCLAAIVLALHPLVRLQPFVSLHLDIAIGLLVLAALAMAFVRSRRPALFVGAATMILFTLALVATEGVALADDGARMVLRPELGDVVELQYSPDGETMHGAFVIRNEGAKSLSVSSAHLVHSDAVPRVPPFITVEIEGAQGKPVVIEPGKQRRAIVRWKYGAARAREFHGLAYVEPSAGRVGGLVPVHAARPRDLGPWGDRALSWIVGFPLLASMLALLQRLLRRDTPRRLALTSTLVLATNLAFVLALWFRFDERFGRRDGNDGLQFVERLVWWPNAGIEWFLGLDGLSLTFVVIASIAGLWAALAAMNQREHTLGFHVLGPMLVTSALGVFLVQDLFFFCLFWFLGAVVATSLIAQRGGTIDKRAAIHFGSFSLAGATFLAAATYWLHEHSDPSYLVDGRFIAKSWALPDLAHVNWANVEAGGLFGNRGIVVVWSALFIAFVVQIGMVTRALRALETPTRLLVPAALLGMGMTGLLRFNVGVMPQGMRWAATTVMVVGIGMMVLFGWLARRQTHWHAAFANLATAYAGIALVGMGSCTPQGMASAVCVVVSLVLGLGLVTMLAQALEARNQTLDWAMRRGLSEPMPRFAAMFLIGIFVLIGMPGLAGFWGPLLALVGAFPRQPMLALLALVVALGLGALGMHVATHILYGAAPEKSRKDAPTDLRRDELWLLAPMALLAVGLGISPRTLYLLLDTFILDVHRLVDAAGALQVG